MEVAYNKTPPFDFCITIFLDQVGDFCITILMPGGRPTSDPKETLVAVRFSERQLVVLQRRAKHDDISLSEAIRRCVDEWAVIQPVRTRQPTPAERETFQQLAALFESKPARSRTRRKQ